MNPIVIDEEWLEEQRQILLHKKVMVFIGTLSVTGALAEYCRARSDLFTKKNGYVVVYSIFWGLMLN